MGIAKHQRSEHANKQTTRGLGVSSGGVAIRTAHSGASSASRSITGGYSRPSKASRRRASQVLVANRGTTPVYDLVDAGPRHRFTADGVLVHNCGYSGGANALKNFGGERMVPPGEDVDTYLWGVVRAWRDAHPEIVALWDRLMNDFVAGEGWFSAPERGVRELHLPSGRSLYYRNVRAGWDEQYDRPRYTAADPKVFGHQRVITRNILTNNLIQATARDLMASALVKAEQRGLRPVVLVHDEMLCEAPENRAHEVQYAMTAPPSWADGLPLDADPVIMARWVKA